MKLPNGIKKVTCYREEDKGLDVITTSDNESLFAADQIMLLTNADSVLNDPYVLVNDDNMISLSKEDFSFLIRKDSNVYNEQGGVIGKDLTKIFWKEDIKEPLIFINKAGLHDIMSNLKSFDYEDIDDWIKYIAQLETYSQKKDSTNEEIESQDSQVNDELIKEFKEIKARLDENDRLIKELIDTINGLTNNSHVSKNNPFKESDNTIQYIGNDFKHNNTPFGMVTPQPRIDPNNPFNV